MIIKIQNYQEGDYFLPQHTCDGENINPQVCWEEAPEEAVSFLVYMYDPDIPEQVKNSFGIQIYNHWLVYDIPSQVSCINEAENKPSAAKLGLNSSGALGYTGPCPPVNLEPKVHRYFFEVWALSKDLDLSEGLAPEEVKAYAEQFLLDKAQTYLIYSRANE